MRRFTDKELLDPNFPDPRLVNHREARHKYYREQVQAQKAQIAKRKSFIERLNEWVHQYNQDAIDADTE